jgi:UDP-galactopyranose mutase
LERNLEVDELYSNIIIGAGIAGSVIARELAQKGSQKVLVIDKKNHIGGNCYDVIDEHGVLIHQYGPHIFHTNKTHVYEYLSEFTSWHTFDHEVVANVHGKLIPIPFNLNTLHEVYDESKAKELEEKLIQEYGIDSRVPILKLRENEDKDIQGIADYVYENIFLKYTMKQWGQKPEEIDPQVTGRVPVVISYDNRYFGDQYQGMPKDGYTKMFENMLNHPNITVLLDTDSKDILEFKEDAVWFENRPFDGNVIYTGAIDEFFNYEYGPLPYRSLNFSFENYKIEDYQNHSVVNYTVSEDYTRITEFKHLTGQKINSTTIVKEYPTAYTCENNQIPYYAINNEENNALYERYAKRAAKSHCYLLGRLAEYKYYNMDDMVDKALCLSKEILDKRKEK